MEPSTAAASIQHGIAQGVTESGFQAASKESLSYFTEMLDNQICNIALVAHDFAVHARRTRIMAQDAVDAVSMLVPGGPKEILEYLRNNEPTADLRQLSTVLEHETRQQESETKTLAQVDEFLKGSTAPPEFQQANFVLPDMPPTYTYKHTPVHAEPKNPEITSSQPDDLQVPSQAALSHMAVLETRRTHSNLIMASLRNMLRSTASARKVVLGKEEGDDQDLSVTADSVPLLADVVNYEMEWYRRPVVALANEKS